MFEPMTDLETMVADRLRELPAGTAVMEVGTLGGESRWRDGIEDSGMRYIGLDMQWGPGVTMVGNLERLSNDVTPGSIGLILCCSVLEHVRHPWVAMEQMSRALRPHGSLLVSTHQSFPLHYYPVDMFRFSLEALEMLMEDAGLEIEASGYNFPCKVVPMQTITPWNLEAEAWLIVEAWGRKP